MPLPYCRDRLRAAGHTATSLCTVCGYGTCRYHSASDETPARRDDSPSPSPSPSFDAPAYDPPPAEAPPDSFSSGGGGDFSGGGSTGDY